jgi:hypothetical protein
VSVPQVIKIIRECTNGERPASFEVLHYLIGAGVRAAASVASVCVCSIDIVTPRFANGCKNRPVVRESL